MKQLEALTQKMPILLEAIFYEEKDLLLSLIFNHRTVNSFQFNKVINLALKKFFDEATKPKIDFYPMFQHKLCRKFNLLYFIPSTFLLSSIQTFIYNIKNEDYLLLRKTLDADILHGFPNFQHSILIRKYMEVYIISNIETLMHIETKILRTILIEHKTLFMKDANNPLGEYFFINLVQARKTLIKIINNLAKFFRIVDDYISLITEPKEHFYFKRKVSDIFKFSNLLFRRHKLSFSKSNKKAANQHFFSYQFNMIKLKTPRIRVDDCLNNLYQRYVTGRIEFSEHVNFWITNI
jgi:hypothetical protein